MRDTAEVSIIHIGFPCAGIITSGHAPLLSRTYVRNHPLKVVDAVQSSHGVGVIAVQSIPAAAGHTSEISRQGKKDVCHAHQ